MLMYVHAGERKHMVVVDVVIFKKWVCVFFPRQCVSVLFVQVRWALACGRTGHVSHCYVVVNVVDVVIVIVIVMDVSVTVMMFCFMP